jgi:hypothetical protein
LLPSSRALTEAAAEARSDLHTITAICHDVLGYDCYTDWPVGLVHQLADKLREARLEADRG